MLSGLVEQAYDTFLRLKQQELEFEVNLGYTGRSCGKNKQRKKNQSNNNNKTNKGHINSKKNGIKKKKNIKMLPQHIM